MARLKAVPETAPRAIMYGRVSALMGRGDELTSPELQEHVVREYCLRRGYQPILWLCDVDKTGRSWTRRQVEHAVKMIEGREADLIVVPRWSRFTRNLRDYVIQTARIETAGGRVESAQEETDPATAAGLLQRDLFAILAQWESRKIGEAWKETHQRRWRAGLPHNNRPRLGYMVVDGRHVPDPDEAPLVVDLYRQYLEGAGLRPLYRWLRDRGVVSKEQGIPWTHHGLTHALDSGFAAGLLRVGGDFIPGAHDSIIDQPTWNAYRTERQGRTTPARHVGATTPLAGLVRCGGCEKALMYRKPSPNGGKTYFYYSCQNEGCESRGNITVDRIEQAIKLWLADLRSESAQQAVDRVVRQANQAIKQTDRTVLLDRLADVESGLDTIEEMFLTRQYTAEKRLRLMTRLEVQKAELVGQLEKLTDRPLPVLPDAAAVERMLDAWDVIPPADMNRWLKTLIGRVVVTRREGYRMPSDLRVWGVWEL